jgi:aminoglycoside phosphotransferase (APT) family kinase protein
MHEEFIGTMPVQERHRFDVERLAQYMRANVEGFAEPLEVAQFKGGQSNPTFLLSTPGKRYVLRRKPPGKLLPSAHAVDREYRVISALYRAGIPVARSWALCEDDSVIGTAFYVMDYVEGRVLWDQALPGMSPQERTAIYDEMNRVIAALHSLNPAQVGLADYGKPGNYFVRQIARWSKQYQMSALQVIPEMDNLIDWLPAHLPPSALDESQVAIVHGDFRLDNLIFDASEPRIAAVLDWELSTLGHPLADFSYHCMGWHIEPGVFRGIGGLDLAALGIPSEREYVRRYCERTGRGDPDTVMADWNFYLAYNLFRLAAITQGIAKRAADGTAASAQARTSGDATQALARMGWAQAQRP